MPCMGTATEGDVTGAVKFMPEAWRPLMRRLAKPMPGACCLSLEADRRS